MPFTLDVNGAQNQYFLTAKTVAAAGTVNIRQIRYDSVSNKIIVDDPAWSRDWNPEYTIYMPFALIINGSPNQYFMTANTTSGAVSIRQIRYDAASQTIVVDDPVWSGDWNPSYTLYVPFVLGDTQYFPSVNNWQGRMNIRPVTAVVGSISVLDPVWSLP
jgi:hypothetical protein